MIRTTGLAIAVLLSILQTKTVFASGECLDLTGAFSWKNTNGQTTLTLRQNGCRLINVTADYGPGRVASRVMYLDGLRRMISRTNEITQYEKAGVSPDRMVVELEAVFKDGSRVTSRSTVTLDQKSNLVEDTIHYDEKGRQTSEQTTVYQRETAH